MSRERLMFLLHRLAERSGLAAMVNYYAASLHAEHKLDPGSRWLFRIRHSPFYPLTVAVLAIVSAGTSLYPFGPVIVAATVFAPNRWRGIVVGAVVGATLGATGLTVAFRLLGSDLLDVWFPALRDNPLWAHSAYWIDRHGALALGAIAALPVPQLPAIALAGLSDLSLAAVAAALVVGKTVKYAIYVLAVVGLLQGMQRIAAWQGEGG